MADYSVQKHQIINEYRQAHPELALCSDEQILSIYNEQISQVQLSEDEEISILSGSEEDIKPGLSLESQSPKLTSAEEKELRSALSTRINGVTSKTSEAEIKNGFLGKAWHWTKNNLLDWCTDSTNDIKKLQDEERAALNGDIKEAFKEITGMDYTLENLNRFMNNELPTKSEAALLGYAEGQEMAVDFLGDMISGIAAVGIYTASVVAAPFTGGASIALGLGLATLSGGLIKSGVKYAESKSSGQEYNSFSKDMITGGFSGLLAPVTGGVGGAVGRGVAAKLGIQVLKQVGKESIEVSGKQTLKTVLTNPVGYEYAGKRWGIALASEMAVDGALGGSIDTTFRTAYEMHEKDEEISTSALLNSFLQGGLGGFLMAPAIGGGMKMSGKLAGKMFGHSDKQLSDMVREIEPEKVWEPPKRENLNIEISTAKKTTVESVKIQEVFEELNNPYLKEHKDEAFELIERMLSMTRENSLGDINNRFRPAVLHEVLEQFTPQNKEIFETLLNAKKNNQNDYLISIYDMADMLKIFSEADPELSRKLLPMCTAQLPFSPGANQIKQIFTVAGKHPEEFALLTNNFDPSLAYKRLFFEDLLDEFIEKLVVSTDEKKDLVRFLTLNEYISNETLSDIIRYDIGVNKGQLQTLCQTYKYYNTQIEKELQRLETVKGKVLSSNNEIQYVKNKKSSIDDNIEFAKAAGLSEEDCLAFCNTPYAESIITVIKFSELIGNQLFGAASRKEVLENCNMLIASGNKEALKEFEQLSPILPYLTKENFEIFKKTKGDDVELFIEDLGRNTTNFECQYACSIITRLTGREIYEQDLIILGTDALKLSKLCENDISMAIKKLKELGLYKDEANILTLLSRAKELCEINVTPTLKEFKETLLQNKTLEEGLLLDILYTVNGKTNEITTSKINFFKEITSNGNISQREIDRIMDKFSSDNSKILNRQLEAAYELIEKNSEDLNVILTLLNVNNLEEFDVYYNLYQLLKDKKSFSKFSSIYSLSFSKNIKIKLELAQFLVMLLEKNTDLDKVYDLVKLGTGNTYDISKAFIDFYTKNIDVDITPIEDCYNDIILLHVSDANSLNLRTRMNLYEKLSSIDDNGKVVLKNLGLDFDILYDKVISSLGAKRPLVSLSTKQAQLFVKQVLANNNPKAENILKTFDFAKFGKNGLPLRYTRDNFNKKVEELLKDLSGDEVMIILKHFGLEKGEAGFDGIPNNRVFTKTDISAEAREAALKIQKEIENFTVKNEVMIIEPEIKEVLDGLIKGMPEFTAIVGKKQHGTHAFSVDIHTLKVLQSAMNNPLYQTLGDLDKTILKYAIILHDFGKKGGVVDKGHASLSADYTWSILERYPLPTEVKDRIIDIVDNHHWFEKYNTGAVTAENVAVRCRKPEDLKIYEIFSKADFENVNSTFHLGEKSGGSKNQAEFDAYMKARMLDIEEAVNRIYQNANFVFDTQFMHNGRQFPLRQVEIDGNMEELRVLNLSELAADEDLSKYGFAPNVTKENARFFVHMTEPETATLATVFRLTETPVFQSTWSTSFIKADNNRTYAHKKFGFIFDTPQANISEAFFMNSGSGNEKSIDAFQKFLFGSRTISKQDVTYDVRHFVKNNFIKEMQSLGYNLNDIEYAALSRYLFNKKYTSQITKDIEVGTTLIRAQDLVKALEKSRDSLFEGEDIHSEIIPINPKVKGLIAKVSKLEDCPTVFLKFAKEHGLPIILMEPTNN